MDLTRQLDLRQLQALVAVADQGTFGRAAEALGFTQSAVSQQIASLERSVGIPVFDRRPGPKPPELTQAGTVLVVHARGVLAAVDDAANAMDQIRRGISGTLGVGTFQSASTKLLPAVVRRFLDETPDVDVSLLESDDVNELCRRILDDDLDLSFIVVSDELAVDDRFTVDELGEDPYVLIRPIGDPGERSVALSTLHRLPMVGQPPDNICQVLIDSELMPQGIEPRYVFRSADNGAIQAMVHSGMGPAIMPYLAIDPNDRGVEVCTLEPPIPARRLAILRRRGRPLPPIADRFVELATSTCRDLLSTPHARVSR